MSAFEGPGKTRESLPLIPTTEQLIGPEGFVRDIDAEIEKGAHTPYPGYPAYEERIKMTPQQIRAWREKGSKGADLPVAMVFDHPNYLKGVESGVAHRADIDSFVPNVETMLACGRIGGNGFYYEGGINETADPVLLVEDEGYLKVCLIERADVTIDNPWRWALPGGMKDKTETAVSALLREFQEETGESLFDQAGALDTSKFDLEMLIDEDGNEQFVMYGDPRGTINAIPAGKAALITPKNAEVARMLLGMRLKPKFESETEVRSIRWKVASADMIESTFSSHPTLIMRAIEQWQKRHPGMVVGKDGTVGRSA